MDDERIKLVLDLAQSSRDATEFKEKLEQLDATARKAGDGLGEVDKSTAKASKSTGDFGRSALETGRIVQDFAQGGLGGIINNLEGFTRAIGLGAGAAGAMTLLGVAVLTATPYIKAWWHEFYDGANKVPASADALKRLGDELETHKKRLGELKEQQSLTNAELVEFNTLTAESIRLEKEAATAKEAAAARNQKTDDQSKLGSAVSKLTGGADFDKVVANAGADPVATAAAKADLERRLKEQEGKVANLPANVAVQRNGEWQNTPNPLRQGAIVAAQGLREQIAGLVKNAEGWNKDAQELVTKARNGDMDAYDELLTRTTGDVHDQLAAVDPRKAGLRAGAQQRAKGQIADAIGGVMNPLISDLKGRNAAAKQGVDQSKIIDAQQDQAGKEADKVLKKQADDQKKAEDKAREDRDKALRLNNAGIDSDAPTAEEVQAMAAAGEFGAPRQTYKPMSHADRIEAARARKARRRKGGGGLQSVAPTATDEGDDGEARQALDGAMSNLTAVAAGAGAWKPAFQQLSAAIQVVLRQLNGGPQFQPGRDNHPVDMDQGDM